MNTIRLMCPECGEQIEREYREEFLPPYVSCLCGNRIRIKVDRAATSANTAWLKNRSPSMAAGQPSEVHY